MPNAVVPNIPSHVWCKTALYRLMIDTVSRQPRLLGLVWSAAARTMLPYSSLSAAVVLECFSALLYSQGILVYRATVVT